MDTVVAVVKELSTHKSVILVVALLLGVYWEWRWPVRPPMYSLGSRWVCNASLHFFNTLIGAWLTPLVGAGVALLAAQYKLGLWQTMAWTVPGVWVAAIVVLDFKHYLFHRLVHTVGWMWQLHCVHHSDLDCDVTTGVRSHPGETVLALLLHSAVVGLLGIPIVVLLVYEMLTTVSQFFTHGNLHINATLDRVLRFVLVTPNMHRIHHSEDMVEGNSNFGGLLTLWDRLFGTYQDKPQLGHAHMVFGVREYRMLDSLDVRGVLVMPFAKYLSQ